MRRFKQQLTENEIVGILRNSTSGVLSLCGDDRIPYGVPLSHVYDNGKLYFHSALIGHKIDLIRQNDNASFTVIAKDEVHPERYTTYFQSAIAFGKVRIIEDEHQKREILGLLGRRCNPGDPEGLSQEIQHGINRCLVLEMKIEKLSGKQAIELVNHQ
ncbi:MAG: pyridoxamine 5'-phosphate oxidase family protein [Muribaculaceae bacterium]|nr:pyridoxamine 5'-phosphate oxidase family protein [Muribaculaceae bacterium]MDE6632149.1 pyridoxamine 5'-phosphate oxidase family protein [Muribaculaceae bacterium]